MPPSSNVSIPDALLAMVKKTVADHAMISPKDRVLVGVSGGPDSMVLLHLLNRLSLEWGIEIAVAHLNHCLRGNAADEDAALVRRTATALNRTFHMGTADVRNVQRKRRLSPEDAARQVRYAFFKKIMKEGGYTRLAVGHHLDDNAEQVLLAFLRGSGSRGLSGIAPVRDRVIIRPLINIRRSAIENYAKTQGIAYRHDASNMDMGYTRNHIRHRLLPFLSEAYNPRIHHQLSQLANIMRNEEAWVSDLTEQRYAELKLKQDPDGILLCARTLSKVPLGLARRLVRRAIEDCHGDLRRITFDHITAVLNLLSHHHHSAQIHLPSGVTARRNKDLLELKQEPKRRRTPPSPPISPSTAQVVIPAPFPDTIESPDMGIGLRFSMCGPTPWPDWETIPPTQAFFDFEKILWPLVLRFPQPGDRFTPLGTAGSQKLKKFFIDHHIPRETRPVSPVLADSDRIIWIVGKRLDDFVRVTRKTSQILKIDFFLLDAR